VAGAASRGASTDRALRLALQEIPGVRRAFLDDARRIWIIAQGGTERARIRADVTGIAKSHGIADPAVEIACLQDEAERIRFKSLDRTTRPDRQTQFRATLSWMGETASGEAVTESGEALELRAAATATLDALQQLRGSPLNYRLVGAKRIHAFDADLVVVSFLRIVGDSPRHLVGTVAVSVDVYHAASLAVLDALNRVLGLEMGSA
jgi:hypothetical protein